jgi:hypothetical protein
MQHSLIHPFLAAAAPEEALHIVAVIAACAFPVAIVVLSLALFFQYRKRKLLHETLRLMIEKGQPIPPELINEPGMNYSYAPPNRSDLRRGLIWLGIGLALILGDPNFQGSGGFHMGKIGLIPLFIGVAFLISWVVEGRGKDKAKSSNGGGQPNG